MSGCFTAEEFALCETARQLLWRFDHGQDIGITDVSELRKIATDPKFPADGPRDEDGYRVGYGSNRHYLMCDDGFNSSWSNGSPVVPWWKK